ncbi:MAG: RDD family protein [Pseudomonadales bacterium]|nr:RDD family protein [Pseudomonadales bacterium]
MNTPVSNLPPAALWRRLAAMVYDSLLVVAIWLMVTFFCLWAFGVDEAQSVQNGQVVLDPLYKNLLFAALLLSSFIFFSGFWMMSGQTLGMHAWHIKIQNADGSPLSLKQCLIRFLVAPLSLACLGLGYFYMFFNEQRASVQDRLSRSQVVLLPPLPKK